MRFYTIEAGQRHDGIELLAAGDNELMVGVTGADGVVEGIPLSPFMATGVRQLGLTHLIEGTVVATEHGPTISTFKRRQDKGQLREPDGPCMLLVKTTGTLTSSMFVDDVKDGRVERHYLPAGDMAGVRVLAKGPDQFLLELLPNASFRIEAEAGTLTVKWTGWDRPYPREVTKEYLDRRQGLQVRVFTERREGERAVG